MQQKSITLLASLVSWFPPMQQAEEAADDSHSSVRTVNAAAVVLAAAARSSTGLRPHPHHLQQLHDYHPAAPTPKRRWWSRLTKTLCFRPHGHPRRVIAADGDSDTDTPTRPAAAAAHTASASAYVHQAPPAHSAFAFAAPPSSPASSLFQSESPSPVSLLNLHGTSPTPSMFAVGPYARGPQQLVSPPVLYSALTTEPSTAPRTPPATTGASSPEVPFARVLASSGGGEDGLLLYHAACQLRQGSPVPLVSPEPGCSPSSSSSSPQLFHRKLHRRNEGSLLDGHIPVASFQGAHDAGDQDGDDEVPNSAGEFMFGNADGCAEDMDGKNWHFFPTAEQHAKF